MCSSLHCQLTSSLRDWIMRASTSPTDLFIHWIIRRRINCEKVGVWLESVTKVQMMALHLPHSTLRSTPLLHHFPQRCSILQGTGPEAIEPNNCGCKPQTLWTETKLSSLTLFWHWGGGVNMIIYGSYLNDCISYQKHLCDYTLVLEHIATLPQPAARWFKNDSFI